MSQNGIKCHKTTSNVTKRLNLLNNFNALVPDLVVAVYAITIVAAVIFFTLRYLR